LRLWTRLPLFAPLARETLRLGNPHTTNSFGAACLVLATLAGNSATECAQIVIASRSSPKPLSGQISDGG